MRESYAVQASESAAAALARRRKSMMTDMFIKGRIQGRGIKVKGLPVVGCHSIGDNLIKPPAGPSRCAVRQLVKAKELCARDFECWFPQLAHKFMQGQDRHMIARKLPVIQAKTFQNGLFFRNNSRLFANFASRRVEDCLAPLHPAPGNSQPGP